jgi:diguanylate cyclase (GGDEF)-like protein
MGRMGHQRFSILLHHAEGRDASWVAERIRDRVANSISVSTNGHHERTVSIGGACLPTHASDLQGVVLTASTMLLRAKSHGGNKVCLPEV